MWRNHIRNFWHQWYFRYVGNKRNVWNQWWNWQW
jgi:hypothetical protein